MKRKVQKLLSIIMAFVIAIGTVFVKPMQASAASNVPGKPYKFNWYALQKFLEDPSGANYNTSIKWVYFAPNNLDGQKFAAGYCLDPKRSQASHNKSFSTPPKLLNGSIVNGKASGDIVYKCMKYGYSLRKPYSLDEAPKPVPGGGDAADWAERRNFYVTQMAIWSFIHGWSNDKVMKLKPRTDWLKSNGLQNENITRMKKEICKIRDLVNADHTTNTPKIWVEKNEAKPDELITLMHNRCAKEDTYFYPKYQNTREMTFESTNTWPDGVQVIRERDNKVLGTSSGGKIKFKDVWANDKFKVVLPPGTTLNGKELKYKIYGAPFVPVGFEFSVQAGKQRISAMVRMKFNVSCTGLITDNPDPNTPDTGKDKNRIRIKKVDEEGNPLQGAEFECSGAFGSVKQETDEQGYAEFNRLDDGKYTVVETSAPSGYELSDEVWEVTLPDQNNHEKVLTIKNEKEYTPPYSITVKKKNEDGDRLEGVKFKCWSADEEEYEAEKFTDRNGIAFFDQLSPGAYYVQEVVTIDGYKLNDTIYKVDVPARNGQPMVYIDCINEENPNEAQIKKVDADTGMTLPGAKFRVTGPDGYDQELTSDENGIVKLTGLKIGDYTVQEIKAPEGYNLATKPYYFTIHADASKNKFEHVLENIPIKNKVKIKKIDEATLQPLKGAKFNITGPDGYSRVEVTNTLGEIDLGDVLYGDYTITEIESPEGYQMLEKPVKFSVTKDGEEQIIKIKNKKKIGELKLYKTDEETGKPLQYAKYRIQGPNGYDVEIQTDKDGIIHVDFAEYGKYTVQEIEAPEGYVLNDKIWEIDVTEHKQVYEIRATNRVAQGKVIIDKVDDIGQPVPNATFEIKRQDGEYTKQGTTDDNGHLEFNKVPWGRYQLKEISAPDGYVLDPSARDFVLEKDQQEFKYQYVNRRIKGQLIITKIDKDTKQPLKGATFEIKKGNTLIQTVTTDDTGVAKLDQLPYGEYTVIEKEAPTGYLLNTTPQKINIVQDAEIYHVTFENKAGKGNIEITKTEDGSGRKLAGAEFAIWDKSMAQVDTVVTGESGVGVSSSLPVGTYYIQETRAPEGYVIDPKMHTVVIGEEGRVIKYSMPNKQILGKVKIKKVDAVTGTTLEGVEFKIYAKANPDVVVDTLITDEFGMATSKELPFGDYIIKESKTPNGYFPLVKDYEFKIDRHDKVVEFTIENKPILVDVIVNKTGETTGKALPGAVFQLKKNGEIMNFKVGTQVISSLTTDSQGKIKFPQKLGVGKYELIEIKAPSGYLSAKPVKFEITADSVKENPNGIVINVKDKEIKGDVKLVKVDEDTGKPMPNITFELFDKNDNSLGKYTTDENGVIEVKDLDYGEYYFKEVSKPHGYVEDTEKIYFMIQKDGQTITLNKTNKLIDGDVELTKVDIDTGETLSGVTFKLVNANTNEVVGTYTTDSTGKFRVNDLPFGKYYIKEIQGLEGYESDDSPEVFYIQESGELITITKYNKKIKGKIQINKTDVSDGKVIPDCGFRIWKDDKKTIVIEGKTDKNGIAEFELGYGKYYYQEFDAPEGYVLDNKLYPFEIKENGEIVKAHMTNEKIKGTMELSKVDISNGMLIPNAKFKIYKEDKKTVVVKGMTDQNGIAKFNLEYGKYYYQEYDAPNGYILDESLFPFEIKINGDIVKCQMTNKPETGGLIVNKVDGKTGESLQGATFGLYCGKSKVLEGVTDQNGRLEITGLSIGTYTLKEEKAPAGYQNLNQQFEIKIDEINEVETLKVCNWKYGVPAPTPMKPLVQTGTVVTTGATLAGILSAGAYIFLRRRH